MKRALPFLILGACATTPSDETPGTGGAGGKADEAGCSYGGLVEEARDVLTLVDAFFADVTWDTYTATTPIADLNGDGRPDVIVQPGYNYINSNEVLVVYVSFVNEGACTMSFAGHVAGTGIVVAPEGRTNGLRDLFVSSTDACSAEVRRYRFDGGRYTPTDEVTTQKLCE